MAKVEPLRIGDIRFVINESISKESTWLEIIGDYDSDKGTFRRVISDIDAKKLKEYLNANVL